MLDTIEFLFDKHFSSEKKFLLKVESPDSPHNKRTLVTTEKLNELKANHPGLPDEYLVYLKNIGWGDFRECGYMIYSGLLTLDSIGLSKAYPLKEKVVFFGDNFSGDMAGFNLDNNYSIVELWHESGDLHETRLSFRKFIRGQIGMGLLGKDLFKM
jgi:hypothetical protein